MILNLYYINLNKEYQLFLSSFIRKKEKLFLSICIINNQLCYKFLTSTNISISTFLLGEVYKILLKSKLPLSL